MNITHYYIYNDNTNLWDLLTNSDELVASFKELADLEQFARTSDKVKGFTGVS